LAELRKRYPFLGDARSERMARAYGALLNDMLASVNSVADMGQDFGGGLTQVEVDWLITREWAKTAEDILMRRTKIGLVTSPQTAHDLEQYLASSKTKGRTYDPCH
jgi:glycerol-3-phosphate dehydrogenase